MYREKPNASVRIVVPFAANGRQFRVVSDPKEKETIIEELQGVDALNHQTWRTVFSVVDGEVLRSLRPAFEDDMIAGLAGVLLLQARESALFACI